MEKQVNGRRSFLKGFGLGGVVLGGAVGGYHAVTREVVALANSHVSAGDGRNVNSAAVSGPPDIGHLAPRDGVPSLMITGDNRPPEPPKPVVFNTNNGYTMTCQTNIGYQSTLAVGTYGTICPDDKLNKVQLAVGKDDRLWLKIGDGWKRVQVEG